MKITINKKDLIDCLSTVSGALDKNSSSILSHIKIEASNNTDIFLCFK
jgi:DNA polymerase III sliding clamp (beta) subunit (PCNA family)